MFGPLRSVSLVLVLVLIEIVLQVQELLAGADEDEIGKHAKGAKEKVTAAAKTAFADINSAATK